MWNEFRNDQYQLRDDLMQFVGYKLSYSKCVFIYLGLIIGFRVIAFIGFSRLASKVK